MACVERTYVRSSRGVDTDAQPHRRKVGGSPR